MMKLTANLFLVFIFSTVVFQSCKKASQEQSTDASRSPQVQQAGSSVEAKEEISEEQLTDESDCVRGKPTSVVKQSIFPKTTFQLLKDSLTAYETVDFDNGDQLIIKNTGCEYYVLSFRFETERFRKDTADSKYWFEKALQLIKETEKGIDAPVDVRQGIKTLEKYMAETKKPEFEKELDYGQNDVRSFVSVEGAQQLTDEKYAVTVTFSVGPL